MHYKELLTLLGECKPTEFQGNPNHISSFVVPFRHKYYDDVSLFQEMLTHLKDNWDINNQKDTFYTNHRNIKQTVLDNIFGVYSPQNIKLFFMQAKALSLSCKSILHEEWSFTCNNHTVPFCFEGVDLWFFKEIGFVVYKISCSQNMNTISSVFNRNLRNFNDLIFDAEHKKITYAPGNGNITAFIQSYGGLELIIDNRLSTYAKTLSAINLEEDARVSDALNEALKREESGISFNAAQDVDVLMQATYLFTTTSDFFPSDAFEPSDSYIHAMANQGGIDIWKHWKGIALDDALGFVSYSKNGGGAIVSAARGVNYLLYIINLYLYITLTQLDKQLSNRQFIDIDLLLKAREEVQILKNQFYVSKIATSFQPNEINVKIHQGLEVSTLIDEVENNILQSYEFSKENYSAMIAIVATLFLVKDLDIPLWGYLALLPLAGIALWQKRWIKKRFKDIFAYFIKYSR